MSNALSVSDAPAAPATGGPANPLAQVSSILSQPAVKRSLPLVFMVGLIGAAALAWMMLSTPPQRVLFASLPESDKAAVAQALDAANIVNRIDNGGSITVNEDDFHKARMLLAGQDLPKAAPGGYAILDQLPMGVSRAVEGERLRQARETELAKSISEIDTVAVARVHLATPEATVFVRDKAEPSASVIVTLEPGRTLSDAQVRSIVNLVASSVPGMKAESVTIVDQAGALLSKSGQEGTAGDARIDFQRRVEDKYRQQLIQLLTPMLGAGNFTAEVQADVDLDESQATRESYDKQGAVVRAEQGNWTGAPRDANAPGGIPGALSNEAPAPTTVAPPPAPAASPVPGQPATPVATPGMKQSDSFARSYDTGKEISVTRAAPGNIKRLSVAVLLKEEPGKPRGQVEIRQIDQLVKATVGFNPGRQDQVTVVSRKFSAASDAAAQTTPFYETGWFAMVLRHGTALVIALLVLLLGVRPLLKAMLKKREEPGRGEALPMGGADGIAIPPPVSAEMLGATEGVSLGDRVGLVRDFTRDNPARAALAVRDMIKTEGN